MVKMSKSKFVFWFALSVLLAVTVYGTARRWFPGAVPVTGFGITAKYLWAVMAIGMAVIFVLSLKLVPLNDPSKIRKYDDICDGPILTKTDIAPSDKLSKFSAEGIRGAVIVHNTPDNVPSGTPYIKKGKKRIFPEKLDTSKGVQEG